MHSKILAYNKETNEPINTNKRFKYLDGSHDLDWDGIVIESLEVLEPVSGCIYFKDYYFSMALKDIEFTVNESSMGNKAGDVFITSRNKAFELDNKSAFTMIRCTLSHDFLIAHFYDRDIDSLNFTENYSISDSNIRYLMLLIYEQAVQGRSFNDPYLNKLFDAFVIHYISEYSDYGQEKLEGILDQEGLGILNTYISSNIGENITSMMLAEQVGLSNYTFLNEFKQLTGQTPHQYLLSKKLEAAKEMLSGSKQSIMVISHILGFTDSSHFSKFFKKWTGVSPSKYRKA